MNKRKPRPKRRDSKPLRTAPFTQLREVVIPTDPAPQPQKPLMPSPPRSARDVLALLSAATGLVLASVPDAEVELLPGSPTTVLVVSGGRARATFILPVPHDEASRALGRKASPLRDRVMDRLWEEQRQDDLLSPDLLHDAAEAVLVA